MNLGEVIRTYRKEKQMTQEEMAGYLGVTAPAVNKWEKGNSFPDISLLAPIARLLGISTDTLLSYEEELTDREINQITEKCCAMMKSEDYDAAFSWASSRLQEYPSCEKLILTLANILDGYRTILAIDEPQRYDEKIRSLFIRLLSSKDDSIVQAAALSLFYDSLGKEEYENAQEYLNRIPEQGFNPRRGQALLMQRKGDTEEAYRLYEQLIFQAYSEIGTSLAGIFSMAIAEEDMDKAEYILEKKKLAQVLEMGRYMETSYELELAMCRKDREKTIEVLSKMVHSIREMDEYKKSRLYEHMQFHDGGIDHIAFVLKKGLQEAEEMGFVREDARYRKILEELDGMVGE
ncbi:helix-turn-helix domain-containing protein [Bariatricus sp. SGI.154]|uniref:helix-turn-helix domain-containing protein n=1 Tax=Bariatricus sp. SGI.154 TaxID=3420549 RepID=UPI003D066591